MSTLENHSLDRLVTGLPPEAVIFGSCRAMQPVVDRVNRLAGTARPVLIEGASGTGKDTLARWIHEHSFRSDAPLTKVHCPAISPMLLESDLFGYEPGTIAHTLRLRPGRIEAAQGGTLFIDGVSEIDPGLQGKLVRLVKDGNYCRIGGAQMLRANVRFIFSCRFFSSELHELFREMNAVHIHLPLLKERLADVPALAAYMVEAWGRKYSVPVKPLSKEIVNLMRASTWPGNLRQLENVVKRYVVLGCEEETISTELLGRSETYSFHGIKADGITDLKGAVRERVKEQERKIILCALHDHRWNRKDTARALGISYQALLHRMRQLLPPRDACHENSEASNIVN